VLRVVSMQTVVIIIRTQVNIMRLDRFQEEIKYPEKELK
jgi:hypothetical protein